MNIFILFGVTGDLARNRIIPAIKKLETGAGTATAEQYTIGVGRKPIPPHEFQDLNQATYIHGELDKNTTYKKLRKQILTIMRDASGGRKNNTSNQIIVYSSLPPHMHAGVAMFIGKNLRFNSTPLKMMFEKPIGTSSITAQKDISEFKKTFTEDELYFVDHYLGKSAIRLMEALCSTPDLFSIPLESISSVEFAMLDDKKLDERASFYDPVGALRDVAQSHLLQMSAVFLRLLSLRNNPKHQISKSQIISKLQIVNDPIFGQYDGYQQISPSLQGSKTETFFKFDTLYRLNPHQTIKCVFVAGKSTGENKSGITVSFRDGAKPSIFIDTNFSATSKDAYVSVFESAIINDKTCFATEKEILSAWKLVERVKKVKTKKLFVYKKLSDILSL